MQGHMSVRLKQIPNAGKLPGAGELTRSKTIRLHSHFMLQLSADHDSPDLAAKNRCMRLSETGS